MKVKDHKGRVLTTDTLRKPLKRTSLEADSELAHLQKVLCGIAALSPVWLPLGACYWRARVRAIQAHYTLIPCQTVQLSGLEQKIDDLELDAENARAQEPSPSRCVADNDCAGRVDFVGGDKKRQWPKEHPRKPPERSYMPLCSQNASSCGSGPRVGTAG